MTDTLRLSFDDPTYVLRYGTGLQRWRIRARKSGAGPNPTVRVDLYESTGPLIGTPIPPTTVSSPTGEVVEGVWDAQALTDRTGANVEALITVERGALDAAVDIAGFPWIATELTGPTTLVSADLSLLWMVRALRAADLTLRWHTLSHVAPPLLRTYQALSGSRVAQTDADLPIVPAEAEREVAVASHGDALEVAVKEVRSSAVGGTERVLAPSSSSTRVIS